MQKKDFEARLNEVQSRYESYKQKYVYTAEEMDECKHEKVQIEYKLEENEAKLSKMKSENEQMKIELIKMEIINENYYQLNNEFKTRNN